MDELFSLTGFQIDCEPGVVATPDIVAALEEMLTLLEFEYDSVGAAVFAVDNVEYLAEIDVQLNHVTIGLCEYAAGDTISDGPMKGYRMMMPQMKKRLDG